MSQSFAAAFAEGDPARLAQACLAQLPGPGDATLGIVYVSEAAAAALPRIVRELAAGTGIEDWVGGVGLGVCALGHEAYDRPAAVAMTAAVPRDGFRLFAATDDPAADLPKRHANWIEQTQPTLALVHGDPRCADVVRVVADSASASGAFLVGGLVSHRCEEPLLAGGADAFGKAGISGLLLSPEIPVATALTQGCVPIGPVRRIDEARENVVMAIDGRPALSVFDEDIGPELARDPRRLGGHRLRRPAGRRVRYRRLSRAQLVGARSAPGLDRDRRRGRAGGPDPVLPPRSRQRARRSRAHAAPVEGTFAGPAKSRDLC